jgi:hypothetical protein
MNDFTFKAQTPEEQAQLDEQLRLHTQRYFKYKLKRNPFPLGGNYPEGYLTYTYLGEPNRNRIGDFLISTFMREEFNGLLIRGEYGTGKSHILYYIRNEVLKNPFFGKQALCFLIQNPSVVPEDILLSMLREVKLGVVQDLIFTPLATELKSRYQGETLRFLADFTNFKRQSTFDGVAFNPSWFHDIFSISYREFVKRLEEQNIKLAKDSFQRFAAEVLPRRMNLQSEIIVNDLVQIIVSDGDNTSKSWETFLSSRLISSKKKSVGVEHYLHAFLELFKYSGVRHVYLLVDEIEDLRTQRLSNRASVEYLATLRKMIQYNYKMFSFVLASTRDAWSELTTLYPAIDDRFPQKIDLLPDKALIKKIVANYLQAERQGSEKNPFAPFSEDAIDHVIESRGMVLRHVLTELRDLLDAAVNQETNLPISQKFVADHLTMIS